MTIVSRINREYLDEPRLVGRGFADENESHAAVQAELESPGKLEEIATLVRSLTYGEMVEYATAVWKLQPADTAITVDNLPALFHRWSTAG